jgi:hypothetical protein
MVPNTTNNETDQTSENSGWFMIITGPIKIIIVIVKQVITIFLFIRI